MAGTVLGGGQKNLVSGRKIQTSVYCSDTERWVLTRGSNKVVWYCASLRQDFRALGSRAFEILAGFAEATRTYHAMSRGLYVPVIVRAF